MAENNFPDHHEATQRDELLQATLDFIGTLTGLKPPPIEVAPPEVFAPFYAFVERVQEITRSGPEPMVVQHARASADRIMMRCLFPEPDAVTREQLTAIIGGMSVSVDVSTGDHDAGHRYFGTVTEVMEDAGDKHGVTLLVQDAKPNFEPQHKLVAAHERNAQSYEVVITKGNYSVQTVFTDHELHNTREPGYIVGSRMIMAMSEVRAMADAHLPDQPSS